MAKSTEHIPGKVVLTPCAARSAASFGVDAR